MSSRYFRKPKPEVSATQLSEFLTASPTRKEGILRQAQYIARENAPPRIRYRNSRTSIARFLASNRPDYSILEQTKTILQGIIEGIPQVGEVISDFAVNDAKLSIEAIDAFIGAQNELRFGGCTFALGSARPERVLIQNVGVSVRPDLIVTSVDRNQQPLVGGLLMYFGKDGNKEELEQDRLELGFVAATLVQMYANAHLTDRGIPDRKLCLAFDVFAKKIHSPPTHNARRIGYIDASCRQIAAQWGTISPPEWWPSAA